MSKKNYYLTRGVCNYTVTIFSGIPEGNKAPAAKTVLKPLSFTTEEQNAYRVNSSSCSVRDFANKQWVYSRTTKF